MARSPFHPKDEEVVQQPPQTSVEVPQAPTVDETPSGGSENAGNSKNKDRRQNV